MSSHRSWATALGIVVSSLAMAGITALVTAPAPRSASGQAAPAPIPALAAPTPEPEPEPVRPPDQVGIEESPVPLTQASVPELLTGVFAAIERDDRAWLARTCESLTTKPMLSEVDGLDAHRIFLWRSMAPRWRKLRAAFEANLYDLSLDGDRARVVFEVGGNLGQDALDFVRVNGRWCFAGY